MRLFLAAALITAFASLLPAPAFAQQEGAAAYARPDVPAQRAAMQRLSPLLGRWQGEASVQWPVQAQVHQTEQVESGLDGLVVVINGTGHATTERTGDPVFRAFAVISYDTRRGGYDVRAYTHEGHATTATGEFLTDGSFRWSFAPGEPVQVRFTITFDQSSWREVGEISRDNGATWMRTLELDLQRVP